jgi:hypothetical protein
MTVSEVGQGPIGTYRNLVILCIINLKDKFCFRNQVSQMTLRRDTGFTRFTDFDSSRSARLISNVPTSSCKF